MIEDYTRYMSIAITVTILICVYLVYQHGTCNPIKLFKMESLDGSLKCAKDEYDRLVKTDTQSAKTDTLNTNEHSKGKSK